MEGAENASRETQGAAEAGGDEETPPCSREPLSGGKRCRPVGGACERPSFGGARSLGWSHPVFVGLISAVQVLSSPKS